MRNPWVYQMVANLPMVVFLALYFAKGMSPSTLILFGVVYAFTYRPLIDYYRMRSLGKIGKKGFWKSFNIIYKFKNYRSLMFGK